MNVPFLFNMVRQKANETALIDSGATENFIDIEVWKTLGIGAFKLKKPVKVLNVDGTENKEGRITKYCWLKV